MVDKTQNSVLGIPAVPKDASPSVQSYLRALAEAVEKSIGIRGDPENRNPTVKELADAGILERTDFSAKFNPNDVNEQNRGYKSVKGGSGGGGSKVKMFTSERQLSGAGKEHIFKHNLGKIPDVVQIDVHFIRAFTGADIKSGDVVTVAPFTKLDASGNVGASIIKNNKEVRIYTGSLGISDITDGVGSTAPVGYTYGGAQLDEVEIQIRALIF